MPDLSVERHDNGTVTVRSSSLLMQSLLAEHGATTVTFTPDGWVELMSATYAEHDHDDQLRHLVDEWGALGVALKLLEGVPVEQRGLWLDRLTRGNAAPRSDDEHVGDWRRTITDGLFGGKNSDTPLADDETLWPLDRIRSTLYEASPGTEPFVDAMRHLGEHVRQNSDVSPSDGDETLVKDPGDMQNVVRMLRWHVDHDEATVMADVLTRPNEFTDGEAAIIIGLTVAMHQAGGATVSLEGTVDKAAGVVRMTRGTAPGWDVDDITTAIHLATRR